MDVAVIYGKIVVNVVCPKYKTKGLF